MPDVSSLWLCVSSADREDEINAFIPEEYWTLEAILNVKGEKKPLRR